MTGQYAGVRKPTLETLSPGANMSVIQMENADKLSHVTEVHTGKFVLTDRPLMGKH